MSITTPRIVALFLVALGLGLVAFGVIRGVRPAGPAHGVRLVFDIEPPVDDAAREIAQHIVDARIGEKWLELRVVPAGDQLVVEVGEDDPGFLHELVTLLERTATLELHTVDDAASLWSAAVVAFVGVDRDAAAAAGVRVEGTNLVADDRWSELSIAEAKAIGCTGLVQEGKRRCMRRGGELLAAYVATAVSRDPSLGMFEGRILAYGRIGETATWRAYVLDPTVRLDGRSVRRAEVASGGVAIEVDKPVESLKGVTLAFVFDGAVKLVATPDRVTGLQLHVPTPGPTEDAAFKTALDLVAILEAAAVHPLHVRGQDTFSRATGFFPRAWPFFAAALVLVIIAAVLWRRRVTA